MQRVEIVVHGRVQGVCFRYFIKEKAMDIGLNGYVRNLEGDKVEIVAEGTEEKIREIIKHARIGPPLARVLEINIDYSEPTNEYKNFSITN